MTAKEQSRYRVLAGRVGRRTATTTEILEFHALGEKAVLPVVLPLAPAQFMPRTILEFPEYQPTARDIAQACAALELDT